MYNSSCKAVTAVAAAADPPGCCIISSLHSAQEEYLLQSSQMLAIPARNSGGKDVLSSFDTFYSMKCVESDQVLRRLGNANIFTTHWNASLPLNSVIRGSALCLRIPMPNARTLVLTDWTARKGILSHSLSDCSKSGRLEDVRGGAGCSS
jgi:hypothetical protein